MKQMPEEFNNRHVFLDGASCLFQTPVNWDLQCKVGVGSHVRDEGATELVRGRPERHNGDGD